MERSGANACCAFLRGLIIRKKYALMNNIRLKAVISGLGLWAASLVGPAQAQGQKAPTFAPNEILFALRPASDNPRALANVALPGQIIGYEPSLHLYRLRLSPGSTVEEAAAKLSPGWGGGICRAELCRSRLRLPNAE